MMPSPARAERYNNLSEKKSQTSEGNRRIQFWRRLTTHEQNARDSLEGIHWVKLLIDIEHNTNYFAGLPKRLVVLRRFFR